VKTGVQEISKYLETLDVLARFGSLRLPSVARPESIPTEIGIGMTEMGQRGFFAGLSMKGLYASSARISRFDFDNPTKSDQKNNKTDDECQFCCHRIYKHVASPMVF